MKRRERKERKEDKAIKMTVPSSIDDITVTLHFDSLIERGELPASAADLPLEKKRVLLQQREAMTTMRRTRQKSLPRTQHSTHLGSTKISGTESEGRSTPTLSRTSRSSDATRSSDSGTSSGGEHRRVAKEGAKEREKDGSKDTTQRRWQKFGRKDKTRTAMSPNQRHMEELRDADHITALQAFWTRGVPNAKEGKYSRSLEQLASFVPKLVRRRLTFNPEAMACPEQEDFLAVLLFADISGFTPLTDRLCTEEEQDGRGVETLTSILNDYFTKMINIIDAHGGDVVKFAGDALFVLWPTDTQGTGIRGIALLACQCALKIQEDLGHYKTGLVGTGDTLRIKIGIGSGPISGLNVGTDRVEYVLVGETLRQATACEEACQVGEVKISPELYSYLHSFVSIIRTHDSAGIVQLERVTSQRALPEKLKFPTVERREDFQKYVPQPVRHVMDQGLAETFLAGLRNVSVMFVKADINITPSISDDLHRALETMNSVIKKYEGILRQFIIDDKGCVLIGGWGVPPLAHEDDAARATLTATEIVEAMDAIGISVAIGVSTGKAFCGAVGSKERREYALVGTIVNLSARLMATAWKRQLPVLVEQSTHAAAEKHLRLLFEKQEPATLKGFDQPVAVWKAVKAKSKRKILQKSATSHRLSLPQMMGRKKEVELMKQVMKEWQTEGIAMAQQAYALVITGESGIGKTALVQTLKWDIARGRRSCEISCDSVHQKTPYYAFRELLLRLFNVSGVVGGSMRDVHAAMDAARLQSLVEMLPEEAQVLGPLLSEVFPVTIEENEVTSKMVGQARSEQLQQTLLLLLQPLVPAGTILVIEDAQYMDEASWALISLGLDVLPGALVVLAHRPFPHTFMYDEMMKKPHVTNVELAPLENDAVEALIRDRLGVVALPDALVKLVQERSSGNPFFIVELLSTLQASGALKVAPGRACKFEEKKGTELPQTVNGLLMAKVDRLPSDQSHVLKLASVAGRRFTSALVLALWDSSSATTQRVEAALLDLIVAELVIRLGKDNYEFKSVTLQEVLYQALLYSQRAKLHQACALYIEKDSADHLTEVVGLLAYHWHLAENWEKAQYYLYKAGDKALREYHTSTATQLLSDALSCLDKLEDRDSPKREMDVVRIYRKLGTAQLHQGLFDKATQSLKTALTRLGAYVPLPGEDRADIARNARRAQKKLKKLLAGLDERARKEREYEEVSDWLLFTRAAYYSCHKDTQLYASDVAISKCQNANTAFLSGEAYGNQILACAISMDVRGALEALQLAKAKTAKQQTISIMVQKHAAIFFTGIAKWDRARNHLQQAYRLAEKMGDNRSSEDILFFKSHIEYLTGNLVASAKFLNTALSSAQKRGDTQSEVSLLVAKARDLLASGLNDECTALAAPIAVRFQQLGTSDTSSHINWLGIQAIQAMKRADWQAAYDLAVELSEKLFQIEPTTYFSATGYFASLEVLVMLYSNKTVWTAAMTQRTLAKRVTYALRDVSRFAQVFNFAQPRYFLWEGVTHFLNKKPEKASITWARGLDLAVNLGMKYEQALLHYWMNAAGLGRSHRTASDTLFSEMQAFYTPLYGHKTLLRLFGREVAGEKKRRRTSTPERPKI